MNRTKAILFAAAAVLGATASAPVWAQAFPNKPIRVITSVGPGSPADVLCRIYSDQLSSRLGQPFVVENRAGGNNMIAVNALLEAPADGYSYLCFNHSNMVPALHKNLPFDFMKVVEPVVSVYTFGFFLTINAKVPAKTNKEFVDFIKANPGKYNYSYLVPTQQIGFEMFAKIAGIDMIGVGYKGMDAYRDLLAGVVHAQMDGPVSFQGQEKEGLVRFLFTAAEKRSELKPEVPTAKEVGLGDFTLPSGLGLLARAGTPKEAISKVNAAMNEAMKTDRMKTSIRGTGGVATGGSPEDMRRQMVRDFKAWTDAAKATNYVPQQ